MTMPVPIPTEADLRDGHTFDAMMRALSRPGELVGTGMTMLDLALCLLDLEVTHFTPSAPLAAQLAATASSPVPIREADFVFCPTLDDGQLRTLAGIKTGDPLYPDTGATLVLGAGFREGVLLKLSGPGIPRERMVSVSTLPAGLWALRHQSVVFPLGWDMFLLGEGKLMGLPRSTLVEVL